MKNRYCVIMAGGVGSRFWPLSRTGKPKQFIDVLGTGKTFIRQTFERLSERIPPENFFVVTSDLYRNLVREQLPEINPENILCEPLRRNTATCIAYASYRIHTQNPDAMVVVTPADHLIMDQPEFGRVIERCEDFASQNDILMTIGIKPNRPETGYGYIQIDSRKEIKDHIYKVKLFTEKPNPELAKTFLKSGDFFWNSGIFIWRVKSILSALEQYTPETYRLFDSGKAYYGTPREQEFIDRIYPECENISIDYGVMEKADNVYVCCADFGWSDIGTWGSLFIHSEKHEGENVYAGDNVMTYHTRRTIIKTDPHKLAVVEGLEDYIVVDSDDILLICRKSSEQSIREMVEDIKKKKKDEFL